MNNYERERRQRARRRGCERDGNSSTEGDLIVKSLGAEITRVSQKAKGIFLISRSVGW